VRMVTKKHARVISLEICATLRFLSGLDIITCNFDVELFNVLNLLLLDYHIKKPVSYCKHQYQEVDKESAEGNTISKMLQEG